MRQLEQKVAIVTGTGTGLGAACARAFVRDGADIVLVEYPNAERSVRDTVYGATSLDSSTRLCLRPAHREEVRTDVKPAPFDYLAPDTLEEAVAALSGGGLVKVLAGGQSLIPVMALRLAEFDQLVDLRRIDELQQIDIDADRARVGAMVRQAVAEQHEGLRSAVPMLGRALAKVGHFQIRNRGTIGGSVAHADPAAELPAVVLALDATLEVVGPEGVRDVAAADFFETTFTTALDAHEILAAIRFPVWGEGSGFAVEEVARRYGDFAIVGAVCGVQVSDGTVSRAAIGLFGMGGTPVRAAAAESGLVGADPGAIDTEAIGAAGVAELEPPGDIHATTAYRKAVGAHVIATAVTRALEEAQRG